MTYPGGKNGSGVYQRIINHMPPHQIYIEGFCGSGAVLRHKKPAQRNIALDRSQDAIELCMSLHKPSERIEYFCGDALAFIPDFANPNLDRRLIDDPNTLIYLDPPYLPETRKGGDLYDFELSTQDHIELLTLVADRKSMIMISGYPSALYDDWLRDWHRIDYQTMTRQGMVDEALWMNFKPPIALHDYRFLGDDYRARERIKRKAKRWKAKIEQMGSQERRAIMEVLTDQVGSN